MSDILKKIESAKSFAKRLDGLNANLKTLAGEEIPAVVKLVAEKAKHGQEFAELIAAAGQLSWDGRKAFIETYAAKANEHPLQAGAAMAVLYGIGLKEESAKYWRGMLKSPNFTHPNLEAQMLAFGLVFPETKAEAEELIKIHIEKNPDVPEFVRRLPSYENFPFMSYWAKTLKI